MFPSFYSVFKWPFAFDLDNDQHSWSSRSNNDRWSIGSKAGGLKADSLQLEKELLYFAWPPTLKLSDWWGLKLHFDRVTHKVVCSLFQFHSYSSASIAQLIIHILSTHTRMLSTQNLAIRNRRVDEVPPEAGDFARIINGSLFSLNGGRSSESMFDLNRGHLCTESIRQNTICTNQIFWTLSQASKLWCTR